MTKILFLNWNGYGNQDIISTLQEMMKTGKDLSLCTYFFDAHTNRDDKAFIDSFIETLKKESPDLVFSYNYFPVVSVSCQKAGIKYVSWVYDNPAVALYSYTLINNCNYVFLFDSQMYETFARQGIKTVHYLPLAAATRRYCAIQLSSADKEKWGGKVSFVGGLYTDRGNFYDRIRDQLPDRTRGFLEGIIKSQLQIDGLNIVEQSLGGKVLEDMVEALGLKPNIDGVETLEYLYSNYVINRKITAIERAEIISQIGEKYPINLYTNALDFKAEGVNNRGNIDYYNEMPLVFKATDINLNITLRSIQRGIPLRAIDIMGCGGFLLTNYQEDMLQFFEPDRDFVYYESRRDLLDKIGYYLKHEEERRTIAENGLNRIMKEHTLEQRLEEILAIVEGGE